MFRRRTAKSPDSVKKGSEGAKRRRRLVRRVIAALVVVFAAIAVFAYDGVRRERGELTAVLEEFAGQVQVLKQGATRLSPARRMALRSKDVVITGARGTATIIFPDGSGIILEPNTRFVIRLLEFARGWRRDRSFMVESGAAVSHVSRFFGAKSRQTICTPTAVTAVRGTGYRVSYLPKSRTTVLEVSDGKVEFQCGLSGAVCYAGQTVRAADGRVGPVVKLSPASLSRLRTQIRRLQRHDVPPSFLQGLEYGLLGIFDPGLQPAGIARGGRDRKALDAARREACIRALERLKRHIETLPAASVPHYVNPWTLAELRLDPQERARILDGFAGRMLDSFELVGRRFVIRATALDGDATQFSATGFLTTRRVAEGFRPSKPRGPAQPAEVVAPKAKPVDTFAPPGGALPAVVPTLPAMTLTVPAVAPPIEAAQTTAVAGITEEIRGLATVAAAPPQVPITNTLSSIPTAPPPVVMSAPPGASGGVSGLAGAAAGLAAAVAIASQHGHEPSLPQPTPEPTVPELPAPLLAALGVGGLAVCRSALRLRRQRPRRTRR